MKTKKLLLYASVIAMVAVYFSCSKNQEVEKEKEINIARQLKFVPVGDRIKERNGDVSRGKIVIVSWNEWGRKKKNCDGWGLCKAKWFPDVNESVQVPDPTEGGASILESDPSNGKYYFDILLADYPPATIPVSELTLIVDEDILLGQSPVLGNDLIIKEGDYEYDSSLRTYGGYRIYLESN